MPRVTPMAHAPHFNQPLADAFATVLLATRKAKGLSQNTVAARAKMGRGYMTILEGARSQPSLDTIFRAAKALEIEPDEFVAQIDATLQASPATQPSAPRKRRTR